MKGKAMAATAKQTSTKAPTKQAAPDSKAAKERELVVALVGEFRGRPALHHFEAATGVLAARVDSLMLKVAACADKGAELLEATVLDDSPEILTAITTNRETGEAAERELEQLRLRLAHFQKRAAGAKVQATAAQIEQMRDQVNEAGEQATMGGSKIDALIDDLVGLLYELGEPLKALFQVSPREIVNMGAVTAPYLFDAVRRRVTAHEHGHRPLPSIAAAMADVAAVAARSFEEQHPKQEA
jgi:hypothetical protein